MLLTIPARGYRNFRSLSPTLLSFLDLAGVVELPVFSEYILSDDVQCSGGSHRRHTDFISSMREMVLRALFG